MVIVCFLVILLLVKFWIASIFLRFFLLYRLTNLTLHSKHSYSSSFLIIFYVICIFGVLVWMDSSTHNWNHLSEYPWFKPTYWCDWVLLYKPNLISSAGGEFMIFTYSTNYVHSLWLSSILTNEFQIILNSWNDYFFTNLFRNVISYFFPYFSFCTLNPRFIFIDFSFWEWVYCLIVVHY